MAGIGSSLSAANATAAASTTAVIAAAEDEVSAAIASLFSGHAQQFHALSAQAADFHSQFAQALNAGARAYASSEAANAGPLQSLAQDLLDPNVAVSVGGHTLEFGTATASSGPGSLAIAVGTNSSAEAGIFLSPSGPPGKLDTAIALGAHSTADAITSNRNLAVAVGADSNASTFNGNHNIAAALGNDLSATAVGGNATNIVTPFGTAGEAAGLLVPNVAVADPSMLVPNVAVSVGGHTLEFGTATAGSGPGSLAIALGANSDASAPYLFNVALALGAGSDATVGSGVFGPGGSFNTAIAVGTNDVATAGAYVPFLEGVFPPESFLAGSNNHAFVVGTGSTAYAGSSGFGAGNHDLAAVLGNMQTATATGGNHLVDIVTPFGTL